MIWNDHRLIDVGNHIALAAMVDLITSVHFELQDGFLSSDGVGDAFGRGGSRVWHFRLCRRSVAAVAIVATAPRRRFWRSRRRTTFSCSRAKLALRSSLPHQGS